MNESGSFRARFMARVPLDNVRPVCKGMFRATQHLELDGEPVCDDEVLVEEVAYPAIDDLRAEMHNLAIKIGLFSPFETESSCPPKYCFTDLRSATAWFVTPVPPVSLDMVLAAIRRQYPPHYNWDRLAYLRDVVSAVRLAARETRQRHGMSAAALRALPAAIREKAPRRLRTHERLAFARQLAAMVLRKHDVEIYHNNITPQTVFFTDERSPRFLNNYSGRTASELEFLVPPAVLHQSKEETFGEQSVDVYCLAMIVFELVTGVPVEGKQFRLDGADDTPVVVGRPAAPASGRQGAGRVLREAAGEAAEAWRQVAGFIGATFDEERFVNFRRVGRPGDRVGKRPGDHQLAAPERDQMTPGETVSVTPVSSSRPPAV